MNRFRELERFPKILLIALLLMTVAFGAVYGITTSRVGYEYEDSILVPTKEGGNTVYSGEIDGMPVSFTVTADNTVTYQYGLKTYGPYIVREDETAIPEGKRGTGVEVRCGEEIVFRGSVQEAGHGLWLTNEDGSSFSGNITITSSNGIITDEKGNIIDPNEPSVSTVLTLLKGPELTHKGLWIMWFFGLVMCVISAVSILFADELFRLSLAFRVQDPEHAEPSDW